MSLDTDTDNNPYQSPNHYAQHEDDVRYQPKAFSLSGRIGRLRFVGYNLLYSLVFFGLIVMAVTLVGELAGAGEKALQTLVTTTLVLLYIPYVVLWWASTVRRLHDTDQSGWLSVLMLVPLVNLILGLYLLFAPGTQGANRFGPRPVANGAFAWILVITTLLLIGAVFAAAIPAYQSFLDRAKALQVEAALESE